MRKREDQDRHDRNEQERDQQRCADALKERKFFLLAPVISALPVLRTAVLRALLTAALCCSGAVSAVLRRTAAVGSALTVPLLRASLLTALLRSSLRLTVPRIAPGCGAFVLLPDICLPGIHRR